MVRAFALVVALAACGGKRPPAVDDAHHHDAGSAAPAVAPPPTAAGTGDLQVRVEWPDAPIAARAEGARDACGSPHTPALVPTTTWGVPDAIVIVDGVGNRTAAMRVTLAGCKLVPRAVVATSLELASAADGPARLAIRHRGTVDHLDQIDAPADARDVLLPAPGHLVTVAFPPTEVATIETAGADPEIAWLVGAGGAAATDANGTATIYAVPAGPHAVTAWWPPRGSLPGKLARGTVTVVPGELAELTLSLAK